MQPLSARGTRLNRRGLETRQHLLQVAVRVLARGGPEAMSANSVAKEAGATWGVVQHQFGDADGLWAAVLEHLVEGFEPMTPAGATSSETDVARRVGSVVDLLWGAIDLPASRAIRNLRLGLPREVEELERAWPRSAAAIVLWDRQWRAACERAFAGLPVADDRLRKVVALLPGSILGLHDERHLVTHLDMEEAREGLVEAVTAYLVAP